MSSNDPLQSVSAPETFWTTTNIAEAFPGVMTPLSATVWGPPSERALRNVFHSFGVLSKRETGLPADEDRALNVFNGRAAVNLTEFCRLFDRMPGTSGPAFIEHVFHVTLPDDQLPARSRRRWPAIAAKTPLTILRAPGAARRARQETQRWWRVEIEGHRAWTGEAARQHFVDAYDRFEVNLVVHQTTFFRLVQPIYHQLSELAAEAGMDGARLMTGHSGHEETAVIDDLWKLSRDRMALSEFLSRHGYHGPHEGEISATVWREDPAPIERLVKHYAELDDDAHPAVAEAAGAADRRRAEAELLAALSRPRRLKAKQIFRLAERWLPLRGVGKVAFLQSLDVARAASRQLGVRLAEESVLADPDDINYLTASELIDGLPAGVRDVVAERRELREHYLSLEMPSNWQGMPPAVKAAPPEVRTVTVLTGQGVSPGVIEGPVRVVTDPATAEVEAGEILVAHTTDPSWASVMYLASALVVDIGGLLSHAAVVARELSIPCVMGTNDGTLVLNTGDLCRVDGKAGTVEILSRSAAADIPT